MHGIWLWKFLVTPSAVKTSILTRTTCVPPRRRPRFYSWGVLRSWQGRQVARNAWTARKKYISRVQRIENGEERKRAIFSTVVTGDIAEVSLSLPFHHSPLFGCGAANKSKTKERNQIHSASLSSEGGGIRRGKGPFPQLWLAGRRAARSGGGDSTPKSEFKGKWKLCENRWHARECEVTLCAGFHLPQLTSSRLDSRGAGTRGEFVQLSF